MTTRFQNLPGFYDDREDDYLKCEEYKDHPVNDRQHQVAFFRHQNGLYYFAVYDEEGGVRIRSEGFLYPKSRDEELSGVLKNIDNPDRYEVIRKGRYRVRVLKDAQGREVGRTCLEKIPVLKSLAIFSRSSSSRSSQSRQLPETEPSKHAVKRWWWLSVLLAPFLWFLIRSCKEFNVF